MSKSVVVTGASSGIGWGITEVLAAKGIQVYGSVRKQTGADRLKSEFGNLVTPFTDGRGPMRLLFRKQQL